MLRDGEPWTICRRVGLRRSMWPEPAPGWLPGRVTSSPSEPSSRPWPKRTRGTRPLLTGSRRLPRKSVRFRKRPEFARAEAEVTAAAREAAYQYLLRDDAVDSDPAELARLAGILGRSVEARGWALVRDGKVERPGPSRPPLAPPSRTITSLTGGTPAGRTLAELCADLRTGTPHRPIAGSSGIVPRYVDEAKSAGLDFVHDNGASSLKRPPETMSGGVALLDFDGDGWLDVYAVQGGSHLHPPRSTSTLRRPTLFRSRGDGTFEDASERAGLHTLAGGYGHGVTVGDYDNDGHPDLFVTRWRSYALLRNRGDGTFEDMTAKSNLGGNRDWPLRPPGRTSTAMAISICTSATTSYTTSSPPSARAREACQPLLQSARFRGASRPCLPERRRSVCRCDQGIGVRRP